MPSWADENGCFRRDPPEARWYDAVEVPHAPVAPRKACNCANCLHERSKLPAEQHDRKSCKCQACSRWRVKRKRAAVEALRWLAKQRCRPKNCGTVCPCPSCNARLALELLEVD